MASNDADADLMLAIELSKSSYAEEQTKKGDDSDDEKKKKKKGGSNSGGGDDRAPKQPSSPSASTGRLARATPLGRAVGHLVTFLKTKDVLGGIAWSPIKFRARIHTLFLLLEKTPEPNLDQIEFLAKLVDLFASALLAADFAKLVTRDPDATVDDDDVPAGPAAPHAELVTVITASLTAALVNLVEYTASDEYAAFVLATLPTGDEASAAFLDARLGVAARTASLRASLLATIAALTNPVVNKTKAALANARAAFAIDAPDFPDAAYDDVTAPPPLRTIDLDAYLPASGSVGPKWGPPPSGRPWTFNPKAKAFSASSTHGSSPSADDAAPASASAPSPRATPGRSSELRALLSTLPPAAAAGVAQRAPAGAPAPSATGPNAPAALPTLTRTTLLEANQASFYREIAGVSRLALFGTAVVNGLAMTDGVALAEGAAAIAVVDLVLDLAAATPPSLRSPDNALHALALASALLDLNVRQLAFFASLAAAAPPADDEADVVVLNAHPGVCGFLVTPGLLASLLELVAAHCDHSRVLETNAALFVGLSLVSSLAAGSGISLAALLTPAGLAAWAAPAGAVLNLELVCYGLELVSDALVRPPAGALTLPVFSPDAPPSTVALPGSAGELDVAAVLDPAATAALILGVSDGVSGLVDNLFAALLIAYANVGSEPSSAVAPNDALAPASGASANKSSTAAKKTPAGRTPSGPPPPPPLPPAETPIGRNAVPHSRNAPTRARSSSFGSLTRTDAGATDDDDDDDEIPAYFGNLFEEYVDDDDDDDNDNDDSNVNANEQAAASRGALASAVPLSPAATSLVAAHALARMGSAKPSRAAIRAAAALDAAALARQVHAFLLAYVFADGDAPADANPLAAAVVAAFAGAHVSGTAASFGIAHLSALLLVCDLCGDAVPGAPLLAATDADDAEAGTLDTSASAPVLPSPLISLLPLRAAFRLVTQALVVNGHLKPALIELALTQVGLSGEGWPLGMTTETSVFVTRVLMHLAASSSPDSSEPNPLLVAAWDAFAASLAAPPVHPPHVAPWYCALSSSSAHVFLLLFGLFPAPTQTRLLAAVADAVVARAAVPPAADSSDAPFTTRLVQLFEAMVVLATSSAAHPDSLPPWLAHAVATNVLSASPGSAHPPLYPSSLVGLHKAAVDAAEADIATAHTHVGGLANQLIELAPPDVLASLDTLAVASLPPAVWGTAGPDALASALASLLAPPPSSFPLLAEYRTSVVWRLLGVLPLPPALVAALSTPADAGALLAALPRSLVGAHTVRLVARALADPELGTALALAPALAALLDVLASLSADARTGPLPLAASRFAHIVALFVQTLLAVAAAPLPARGIPSEHAAVVAIRDAVLAVVADRGAEMLTVVVDFIASVGAAERTVLRAFLGSLETLLDDALASKVDALDAIMALGSTKVKVVSVMIRAGFPTAACDAVANWSSFAGASLVTLAQMAPAPSPATDGTPSKTSAPPKVSLSAANRHGLDALPAPGPLAAAVGVGAAVHPHNPPQAAAATHHRLLVALVSLLATTTDALAVSHAPAGSQKKATVSSLPVVADALPNALPKLLDFVFDSRFDFLKQPVRSIIESLLPSLEQFTNTADMFKLERLEALFNTVAVAFNDPSVVPASPFVLAPDSAPDAALTTALWAAPVSSGGSFVAVEPILLDSLIYFEKLAKCSRARNVGVFYGVLDREPAGSGSGSGSPPHPRFPAGVPLPTGSLTSLFGLLLHNVSVDVNRTALQYLLLLLSQTTGSLAKAEARGPAKKKSPWSRQSRSSSSSSPSPATGATTPDPAAPVYLDYVVDSFAALPPAQRTVWLTERLLGHVDADSGPVSVPTEIHGLTARFVRRLVTLGSTAAAPPASTDASAPRPTNRITASVQSLLDTHPSPAGSLVLDTLLAALDPAFSRFAPFAQDTFYLVQEVALSQNALPALLDTATGLLTAWADEPSNNASELLAPSRLEGLSMLLSFVHELMLLCKQNAPLQSGVERSVSLENIAALAAMRSGLASPKTPSNRPLPPMALSTPLRAPQASPALAALAEAKDGLLSGLAAGLDASAYAMSTEAEDSALAYRMAQLTAAASHGAAADGSTAAGPAPLAFGGPSDAEREAQELASLYCSYRDTGSEYSQQHWYYCYTCSLVFSEGCCSVCARVCHAGHELSYARFSRFFCDCGAGSSRPEPCAALHPREYVPGRADAAKAAASPAPSASAPPRTSAPSPAVSFGGLDASRLEAEMEALSLASQISADARDALVTLLRDDGVAQKVLLLASNLLLAASAAASDAESPNPAAASAAAPPQGIMPEYAQRDLFDMSASMRKASPQLVHIATSTGSGTFEPRFQESSSRGAHELIDQALLKRSIVAFDTASRMATAEGCRVVIHDAAILGSTDSGSSTPKSALPHLSSTSLEWEPISLTFNPANPAFLAVAGFRNAAVLTLSGGQIVDCLPIMLSLELFGSSLHVVSVDWLPGSEVKLVVTTNEWIKVYDLSSDTFAPINYFSMDGIDSIRDVTIMTDPTGVPIMFIMAARGSIFKQQIFETTDGGQYIITDMLQIDQSVRSKNGIAVHYSADLRLLFASYGNGSAYAYRLDDSLALAYEAVALKSSSSVSTPSSSSSSSGGMFMSKRNQPRAPPTSPSVDVTTRFVELPQSRGLVMLLAKSGFVPVVHRFDGPSLHTQVVVPNAFSYIEGAAALVPRVDDFAVVAPGFVILQQDGSLSVLALTSSERSRLAAAKYGTSASSSSSSSSSSSRTHSSRSNALPSLADLVSGRNKLRKTSSSPSASSPVPAPSPSPAGKSISWASDSSASPSKRAGASAAASTDTSSSFNPLKLSIFGALVDTYRQATERESEAARASTSAHDEPASGEPAEALPPPTFPITFFEDKRRITNSVSLSGDLPSGMSGSDALNALTSNDSALTASGSGSTMTLRIEQSNSSRVFAGIRLLVGHSNQATVPATFTVFGRVIETQVDTRRWYDIPFTDEESAAAETMFELEVGPCHSTYSSFSSVIDQMEVYAISKVDLKFDDVVQRLSERAVAAAAADAAAAKAAAAKAAVADAAVVSRLEGVAQVALAILSEYFSLALTSSALLMADPLRTAILDRLPALLAAHSSGPLHVPLKALLRATHGSADAYYRTSDSVLLASVRDDLAAAPDAATVASALRTVRKLANHRLANLSLFIVQHPTFVDDLCAAFWTLVRDASDGNPFGDELEDVTSGLTEVLYGYAAHCNALAPHPTVAVAAVAPAFAHIRALLLAPSSRAVRAIAARSLASLGRAALEPEASANDDDVAGGPSVATSAADLDDEYRSPTPMACDGCGVRPLVGVRATCSACVSFNLCAACARAHGNPSDAGHAALETKAELVGHSLDHALVELPLFVAPATSLADVLAGPPPSDAPALPAPLADLPLSLTYGTGLAADLPRHLLTHLLVTFSQCMVSAAGNGDADFDAVHSGEQLVPLLQVVYALAARGFCAVWADLDAVADDDLVVATRAERMDATVAALLPPRAVADNAEAVAVTDPSPLAEGFMLAVSLISLFTSDRETLAVVIASARQAAGTDAATDAAPPSSPTARKSTPGSKPKLSVTIMTESRQADADAMVHEASLASLDALVASLASSRVIDTVVAVLAALVPRFASRSLDAFSSSSAGASARAAMPGALLKAAHKAEATYPLSPFFDESYVAAHSDSLFENFPELVTRVLLTFLDSVFPVGTPANSGTEAAPEAPADSKADPADAVAATRSDVAAALAAAFADHTWAQAQLDASAPVRAALAKAEVTDLLSTYIEMPQTAFARLDAKRVLLALAGSMETFYEVRDAFSLDKAFAKVNALVASSAGFETEPSYSETVDFIQTTKGMLAIAQARPANWQAFAGANPDAVRTLLATIFRVPQENWEAMLELLVLAFVSLPLVRTLAAKQSAAPASASLADFDLLHPAGLTVGAVRAWATAAAASTAGVAPGDAAVLMPAVDEVPSSPASAELVAGSDEGRALLASLIDVFLLHANSSVIRTHTRNLMHWVWHGAARGSRVWLFETLVAKLPHVAAYGRNGVQFTELMCFVMGELSLDGSDASAASLEALYDGLMGGLSVQNALVADHPNSGMYRTLSTLVEFDGYFLESDPCLVCNDPEAPFSMASLESLQSERKYTDATQVIKFMSSVDVSQITIRISDGRQSGKSVALVRVYYNNKPADMMELKNNESLWTPTLPIRVPRGASEATVDLPIPITALNVKLEFAEFYDNVEALARERLQCPRCSRPVNDRHGVCSNCSENAYQCRSCRNINYDNLEAFLCNECGFCRYGRFEFMFLARPSFSADKIESDDDYRKALEAIDRESGNAHRRYKQLDALKAPMDALAQAIPDPSLSAAEVLGPAAAAGVSLPSVPSDRAGVNAKITLLAEIYNKSCKSAFNSLSHSVQTLLGTRRELVRYRERAAGAGPPAGVKLRTTNECFGCGNAFVSNALAMLEELASKPSARSALVARGVIQELVGNNLHQGSADARADARRVLTAYVQDNEEGTALVNDLLRGKLNFVLSSHRALDVAAVIKNEMQLLRDVCLLDDACWESRLKLTMETFFAAVEVGASSPVLTHSIILPALSIIRDLCGEAPADSSGPGTSASSGPTAAADNDDDDADFGAVLVSAGDDATTIVVDGASIDHDMVMLQQLMASSPDLTLESLATMDLPPPVRAAVERLATLGLGAQDDDAGASAGASASSGGSAKTDDEGAEQAPAVVVSGREAVGNPRVAYDAWMSGDAGFASWEGRRAVGGDGEDGWSVRERFLAEKYAAKWRTGAGLVPLVSPLESFAQHSWVAKLVLSECSAEVRAQSTSLIESLCGGAVDRTFRFLDFCTGLLGSCGAAGDASKELFELVRRLLGSDSFGRLAYLVARGFLGQLCGFICAEVERIAALESQLTTDIAQGYVLKFLVGLLVEIVSFKSLRAKFKAEQHIVSVLDAFLSLRGLVVQKTRLTEDSAVALQTLITDLNSESEEDTINYMVACVKALDKHSAGRTPIFIFEQLCGIVCPEKTVSEVYVNLQKSRTQEEFIRGSMTKNPYSSAEVGPLMRDVKNKICRDLELLGLIDDDNGMELLVVNRNSRDPKPSIISLSLPVTLVYERVWQTGDGDGASSDPMKVVYRLQGLDGEATEPMIDELEEEEAVEVDPEVEYALTGVFATEGGIAAMMARLAAMDDFEQCGEEALLVLRLLNTACKIAANRSAMIELNAVPTLLAKLMITFPREELVDIAEAFLLVLSQVVTAAAGGREVNDNDACAQVAMFLDKLSSPLVRKNKKLVQSMTRILPYLALGSTPGMELLADFFLPVTDFAALDPGVDATAALYIEALISFATSIPASDAGGALKSLLLERGLVASCTAFLADTFPLSKKQKAKVLVKIPKKWTDEKMERPGVPYVLRVLAGLVADHQPTQDAVADADMIPVIHLLEEVSLAELNIGSLAEDLLRALGSSNAEMEARITAAREASRTEKAAKALRHKIKTLEKAGFKVDAEGNVIKEEAKGEAFDLAAVEEEAGNTCMICREGYKFRPAEVLGFYTYSTRQTVCGLDDGGTMSATENGYTTVTQFNVVHFVCHQSAAEADRKGKNAKEEWDGAALRNNHSRCNNILPMFAASTQQSSYLTYVEQYWSQLFSATGRSDMGRFRALVHDTRILLSHYADADSFVDYGGRESNLKAIPHIIQLGLALIDTIPSSGSSSTSSSSSADGNRASAAAAFTAWFNLPVDQWAVTDAGVDSTAYALVASLWLVPLNEWLVLRPAILDRVVSWGNRRATARAASGIASSSSSSSGTLFASLLPALTLFALVDKLHTVFKDGVSSGSSSSAKAVGAAVDAARARDGAPDLSLSHSQSAAWVRSWNASLRGLGGDVVETIVEDVLASAVAAAAAVDIASWAALVGGLDDCTDEWLNDVANL